MTRRGHVSATISPRSCCSTRALMRQRPETSSTGLPPITALSTSFATAVTATPTTERNPNEPGNAAGSPHRHLERRQDPFHRRVLRSIHGRQLPGHVLRFRGSPPRRNAERDRGGRKRRGEGPEPHGAPAEPRLLRRRALPAAQLQGERDHAVRRRAHDRRRADAEGPDRAGRDPRPHQRSGSRPVRRRAARAPARGQGRPDQVRAELEQPAPERRPGAGQRGHDHRRRATGEGDLMRVLGISGSLRRDSHNTKLLRAAGEIVERHGGQFELFDGLKALPPYDEDDDVGTGPAPVVALKQAVAAADALLFATPEYNSSVPGVLKNAVDWASRPPDASPLRNKPVAVIGASTGMFGAVWAQAELRKVLGAAGARVTDVELAMGHAHEHLDAAGHPTDPAQEEALRDAVGLLLDELQGAEVAA